MARWIRLATLCLFTNRRRLLCRRFSAATCELTLRVNFDGVVAVTEAFLPMLLRAPGPANDPRYDRLDPSVGLDLNLADRCVIEYPQIVVARPGDVDRRFRLAPNPVQLFFADDQSTSAGGHGEMRRA